MVEWKLFKTKLCVLYQKGHCSRRNCSFAHGNAELRQSFRSYNGKWDHRGADLRDKLDRRFSPRHRYSPGKDTRGSSPSRSFENNSDKKRKEKEHFDGQIDVSGSSKSLDGADQIKRRKNTLADSKIVLKDQIKEVESEIKILDRQKSQLKTLVEEKDEEVHVLTSRIRELDSQLSKEGEECKRIISKIKKFVKAHKCYVRVQEELKRSHVRLQKLGDQFGSGTNIIGDNEEDSSINIVSDEDVPGSHAIGLWNGIQNVSFPGEKSQPKCGGREELTKGTSTLGKLSQLDAHPDQLKVNKNVMMADIENDGHQPVGNEGKQKKGKSVSASIFSSDKLKGSSCGLLAPSTSVAAHAVDEIVEIEMEKNIEVVETDSVEIDKGAGAYEIRKLPFLLPPPPPIPRNTYSQYKGKDKRVDVEGLDEKTVNVEIV